MASSRHGVVIAHRQERVNRYWPMAAGRKNKDQPEGPETELAL
jgi:hypothetical protein